MLSRQNAGGTILVMVGQAAVVTVEVETGHPEGMGVGKTGCFWATQWAGVIMLEGGGVSCRNLR